MKGKRRREGQRESVRWRNKLERRERRSKEGNIRKKNKKVREPR
jgi:hypothetical protein